MSGFKIMRDGETRGLFLLSRVSGQARVVDIRVVSEDQSDWTIGYRLAADAARLDLETCEILGVASTTLSYDSLKSSGFRDRGRVPLFVHDRDKVLAGCPPLFWNMIDGDAAYLNDPAYPYAT
jgi:hypothetical protein